MAQTVTLALIALIFASLGLNERNFLVNAQKHSATILQLFTSVSTENVPIGERDKELAKKLTVQLTPSLKDNRKADVVVPISIWRTLQVGDSLQVWAYAEKPKWVFWSPMIRYQKRGIWVKINFSLMSIFIALALWSHIVYLG